MKKFASGTEKRESEGSSTDLGEDQAPETITGKEIIEPAMKTSSHPIPSQQGVTRALYSQMVSLQHEMDSQRKVG